MKQSESVVESKARELEVLSQAVIGTDTSGQVVYWSQAAEKLYGWSAHEAVGRSITDLTPSQQSRDEARRIMDALRNGRHWTGEFAVQRKDGSMFLAHVVDAPVYDERGDLVGIVGLSSDVSPVVQLQRLARDLSAALTPNAVARAALAALMDVTGASAGSVMTLDDTHQCLETVHTVGYEKEVTDRFHTIPVTSSSPIAVAAQGREPLFVTSAREWAERFPTMSAYTDPRTQAWIALPLEAGGNLVGAVGLSVRICRTFEPEERELVIAMARHAAVALERADLYRREQHARREAELARARAEDANRAKSAFLANMSHELRTPLGAIIGYHDLIAAEMLGPLTAEQRDHLQRLRNNATHLMSVIDELLTFSRLGASREAVHPQTVKLSALAAAVSDVVAPLARAKALEFSVSLPSHDVELRTDLQKLKQITINLAANAVKYTERGYVRVNCSVQSGMLRVIVSDSGIGIAPEHLESVFEAFWQVPTMAGRAGGTGLGLSVSRSLAQLLGGTIRVTSEVGKGSVFALEVPTSPQS